ncbi:hypothetical protein [Spirosoma endophyticum]|uniref:Uncharacterized protein n=1 Tax=Spirosoma endophyticum TaxID=662367 RepID=A0A1I1SMF9_9BACT|nr:hypothetical protein [Spirosoma endophyticum]SFD47657.1 hypothetical protein SAMN05216167_105162 [Spirosoma endophyticum]
MSGLNRLSLQQSLKAPALKKERKDLEAHWKTLKIGSLEFKQVLEELRELNTEITKAEVQDDLLTMEAMANIGMLV